MKNNTSKPSVVVLSFLTAVMWTSSKYLTYFHKIYLWLRLSVNTLNVSVTGLIFHVLSFFICTLSLYTAPNEMNGIGCHPNEVFILILGFRGLRSTPAAGCKVSFLVKHFTSKPGKLLNYDFGANRNLSTCAVYWNAGCRLSHPNCFTFPMGVERWMKAKLNLRSQNAELCFFLLRCHSPGGPCVYEAYIDIEELIFTLKCWTEM